jgi:hypothetical protein
MLKMLIKVILFKITFIIILMLTFVLPLYSYKDINIATNILFPSIYQFFNSKDLKEIIIILNKKDFDIFNLHLNKIKNIYNIDYYSKFNIRIIDENELYSQKVLSTYYLQMLLKLLVSNCIDTDYYISLDADNIFTKNCNKGHFCGEKAYYHHIKKKDKWLNRSEKCLDVNVNFNVNQTPFVFKTDLVRKMISDIDLPNFILKKYCSEYTLYLAYLVKYDLFYSNYENKNFTCQIINQSIVDNINEDIEIKLNESFLIDDDKVITCIQSRTNTLDKLIDIIKIYIDNITYKKLKIGMITVISQGEYFKRYEDALFVKKDYCKYYNYDFIVKILEYCDGWDKLSLLYEKLNEDYDYIMTSDADVVITNRDKSIEDLILKYANNNISERANNNISNVANNNISERANNISNIVNNIMLITKDYNSINSGNIIWRNCEETKIFLRKVLDVRTNIRYTIDKPFKPIGVYEQPSIIYVINKEYEYYKDKINIIPQYEMNSYLPIVCKGKTKERGYWEVNDFLIHFAGFNYSRNSKLREKIKLDQIIKKFCNIYRIRIIQKEGRDYGNIK